jgi:hypothetical protein
VALYGVTDGWPLDVAKHVDEIEVRSDHGLKDATSGELFHKAAPVGESFGGSGEPDAPLVHTQKRGAQLGPVGVHDAFGVAGAKKFTHLYRYGFIVFLALPTEPGACEPTCLVTQATLAYRGVQLRESA